MLVLTMILLGVILVFLVVLTAMFLARGRDDNNNQDNTVSLIISEQLKEIRSTLDSRMGESTRTLENQLHRSGELIRFITEELTRVGEGQKQVLGFADELRSLQDILKNPKQRGILGEYYLETLLKNVLPPGSYQMQYPFADGATVDAVVFVKDKIIPIDSKFSLENYNRLVGERDETERKRLEQIFKADLKNRIDETSKYVKPSEGTMDFAMMFIPHEAIYYDLLVSEVGGMKINTRDLIEYAFKNRHVIIVSPTSFLAYLQTVLQGLRGMQIEESAKEIRKNVEALGKHLMAYEEYFKKLGGHLGTAINTYNLASKELGKVDKDVTRITGAPLGLEPELLDRPTEDNL